MNNSSADAHETPEPNSGIEEKPTNSEPSKTSPHPAVRVAVIAAVSGLLGGLIPSSVTLYNARESARADTNKGALEYLNRKVSVLEQHKKKLLEVGSKTSPDAWKPGGFAKAAADAVDSSYRAATQVFSEVKYYLPNDVASRLENTKATIDYAVAFERAKAHGIIKKDSDWKGPPHKFKSGPDILDQMIKFSREVASAVDSELESSVRRIESIVRLTPLGR